MTFSPAITRRNIRDFIVKIGLMTHAQHALEIAGAAVVHHSAQTESISPAATDKLIALLIEGRYSDVENQARLLADRNPMSGEVWKILGIALSIQGKAALSALQKAAEFLPEDAEAHNNLALALRADGRFEEAASSYRRSLEIKPDYAGAHANLGNLLQDIGQFDDAVASYRRALEIDPNYAEAHSNLGNALRAIGRVDDAAASYRRALELKPDYAEAHSNLGTVLWYIGQLDDSVASCRRALELKPDYAEAHNNLGNALQEMGRFDEAVASYRRALEIMPDYPEAHSNLGNALKRMGRIDDAVASYRRALEIRPDFAIAHTNLGNALNDLGRLDQALISYRLALDCQPGNAYAYSNLLFACNYLSDQPATTLLSEARRFGEMVARRARPYSEWLNLPDPGRCLRIGVVSGDLYGHPVGYFVEGVLAALASNARGRLEFIAYPTDFRADALTERIKASCHGWHSAVGLSDERLAQRIREDGIDILIDLSGHTGNNRLPMFAWKPAPVQVSWLGYFATTGVAAIDYLIADPWTLPETEEVHFTEKIWRLPETRLCFTAPELDVSAGPLPALANGYPTFGCFNSLAKMNDAVVALWARVIASVPHSRLFLKTGQFAEASAHQATVERFAAQGITEDRLILEGPTSRERYLAAYQRVDIGLDPFPYTGGTTTAESLWMGVPVLTLAGERFLSRQGVGLLMNAGLTDWVAVDMDDYVARAVSHAADLQRLATLRHGLRQHVLASPIFDAQRFARHFETALRGMWTQWCNQSRGHGGR